MCRVLLRECPEAGQRQLRPRESLAQPTAPTPSSGSSSLFRLHRLLMSPPLNRQVLPWWPSRPGELILPNTTCSPKNPNLTAPWEPSRHLFSVSQPRPELSSPPGPHPPLPVSPVNGSHSPPVAPAKTLEYPLWPVLSASSPPANTLGSTLKRAQTQPLLPPRSSITTGRPAPIFGPWSVYHMEAQGILLTPELAPNLLCPEPSDDQSPHQAHRAPFV